ncbi:glycoside hydrolase family 97 protein [Seonamhaeicola sp.]|uniref:glycoside hydrolase family 97 protein n=1 Tax=Seonamhaeicola sp. TaxID=1912245 RepID=UPI0026033D2B|nr:glycoside hydrolase family 97 protein [Seonamhaeicola sp.]
MINKLGITCLVRCALSAVIITVVLGCDKTEQNKISISSPDNNIILEFDNSNFNMAYSIIHKNDTLISNANLGFEFKNIPSLKSNLEIKDFQVTEANETWEQPWGQNRLVRDHHKRLLVHLEEKESLRKLSLEFKVFNDGVGFRYLVPEQEKIDSVNIMNELTEFAFTKEHEAWHIPAFFHGKYEQYYKKSKLGAIETAETPITIKTLNGKFISLHEAALVDYSSMALKTTQAGTLKSELYAWQDGVKVKLKTPFKTPWRTIQIGDKPGDLIESNLIINLNEPNKLGDVSWVNPMKYIGIWWGIHIGNWTWNPGPNVGATTENTKKYIDFAAKYGFDEVLVEGWNEGFEEDWHSDWGPNQNFTKPHDRYDLRGLQDYAMSKDVTIQAYNETCANTTNFLNQIDDAFKLYEDLGYKSVKVGHVNRILDTKEFHHSQYGVSYFNKVVEKGAQYHLAINFHEAIKPTGLRRTYPNLVARESARGQEFNAWGENGGNPPEHLTILPFTRLLGGPMDFTPGIFQIDIPQQEHNQVNTTLCKQLALYVVIYSPIQMAADLIENYEKRLDAFQFIRDVPVNWETTKILDAQIGDYIVTARKDINSEDWFLGAITDAHSRTLEITLDFLEAGTYEAQIYRDSDAADYAQNPMAYIIESQDVSNTDVLKIKLARSGGLAIRFKKK